MLIDLIRLFYPNCCISCNKVLVSGEELLCIKCLNAIPKPSSFKQEDKLFFLIDDDRIMHFIALFEYEKNQLIQKLIHSFKYKDEKKLGKLFATELAKQISLKNLSNSFDYVVAVPISKKRKRMRGYNQTAVLGIELAGLLNKPFLKNILERVLEGESQTKQSAFSRWKSVENSFKLKEDIYEKKEFEGKHFLIVDDVVTTAATLEACAKQLLLIDRSTISFGVIAIA